MDKVLHSSSLGEYWHTEQGASAVENDPVIMQLKNSIAMHVIEVQLPLNVIKCPIFNEEWCYFNRNLFIM